MTQRKNDAVRPYPPEYCSISTVAYRLDCSETTVEQYALRGLLPPARMIGNLKRWRWNEVESWIAPDEQVAPTVAANDNQPIDPYEKGVRDVSQ